MGSKAASKVAPNRVNAAYPLTALHQTHSIILLRWVLIVATSYLVLFSTSLSEVRPLAALFIAAYLASNVALMEVLPRWRSPVLLEWCLVLFDIAALTVALLLTPGASNDLFVLYFAVLFLSALSERIGLIAAATVLIILAHLYTATRYVDLETLLTQGYMLRLPFLFVVGVFFGHLVHRVRGRERGAESRRTQAVRLELLAGISHDLKNPLGVIESLADLLLEGNAGPLNEQQTDLTNRIRSSTRQVIALSQNLMDAERIQAGRWVIQPQEADLTEIVERALVVARNASLIKRLTLQSAIDARLRRVWLDPVQTERLVANLLGNAIKFTPAGGCVRLHVRAEVGQVAISVTDNGPGIPAHELPRLTERHFRGAAQTITEGSGLGLFIVRAVAEAHGGTVSIDSAVPHGTIVTVRLPLVADALAEACDVDVAPCLATA